MVRITQEAITFDDVLLRYSNVLPHEVCLKTNVTKIYVKSQKYT
jgi:IMP dehydrogenase/GMP reductase